MINGVPVVVNFPFERWRHVQKLAINLDTQGFVRRHCFQVRCDNILVKDTFVLQSNLIPACNEFEICSAAIFEEPSQGKP